MSSNSSSRNSRDSKAGRQGRGSRTNLSRGSSRRRGNLDRSRVTSSRTSSRDWHVSSLDRYVSLAGGKSRSSNSGQNILNLLLQQQLLQRWARLQQQQVWTFLQDLQQQQVLNSLQQGWVQRLLMQQQNVQQ